MMTSKKEEEERVVSDGTFELPIVDFTPFWKDSQDDHEGGKRAVAQAIDDACRHHGFVCLRNSGIPRSALVKAFEASQNLFQMSPQDKLKLQQLNPTTNTGYNGFQAEALNRRRAADLKETFNVRNPQVQTEESFQGTPPDFQSVVSTMFWEQTTLLSRRFAECCAMALDMEESNYFVKTLKDMDLCTLRMLCYPPCPPTNGEEDSTCAAIRVGEHTDFGAFTLLFVHDLQSPSSHGLQVKPIEGGDLGCGSLVNRNDDMFASGWKDVVFDAQLLKEMDEQDDTCPVLVNTGALMARWTNDVWRATAHRVVVKPQARNSTRYSMAMFVDPDKTTTVQVHPKFVLEGEQPKYPPINSLDYLMMKLKEAQGINIDDNVNNNGAETTSQ